MKPNQSEMVSFLATSSSNGCSACSNKQQLSLSIFIRVFMQLLQYCFLIFKTLLINYARLTYWYINKIWCVCLTNIKIFWWLLATKRVWFAIFYYISFWDNRATTVITFLFSVKIIFVTSATELITRWIFNVYIVLNIKSFISLEADKNSNNLNE